MGKSSDLLLVIVITSIFGTVLAQSVHGTLLRDLLDNGYDTREWATTNASYAPLNVTVSLRLFAFLGLEDATQIFSGASWLIMEWEDRRLTWDPSKYDDTDYVILSSTDVWYPKIYLSTGAGTHAYPMQVVEADSTVIVLSNGSLNMGMYILHSSYCAMQIHTFPFDEQTCRLRFDTQNYPSTLVRLIPGSTWYSQNEDPMKEDFRTRQWVIIDFSVNCGEQELDAFRGTYLSFEVLLERQPGYYLTIVFFPSTLLTLISGGVFWLPPDCGEKLSYSISIMLGLSVFQLVLTDSLPRGGTTGPPLLVLYTLMNFALVGCVVLGSVIVLAIYYWPVKDGNMFSTKVILFLDLFCKKRDRRSRSIHQKKRESVSTVDIKNDAKIELTNQSDCGADTIENNLSQGDENATNIQDQKRNWSIVVDRVFFALFVVTYLTYTIAILIALLLE